MSAVTASGARRAAPRRATSPRVPRRVSGPAAARAAARPVPQHIPTVGARALAVVRSLPNHSLIDRLVRGRAWIPVLGVLLAGIVFTQVEILKLGNSLGRSMERTTTLESQNESLQAGVATLADDQRIERLAAGMGMTMPSFALTAFVPAQPETQLGKALANIHSPDPADFETQLASQIASAALITPSAATTTTTTTSAGESTGTTSATDTGTPTAPASTGASASSADGGVASAGAATTGAATTGAAATTTGAAATTSAGSATNAAPTDSGATTPVTPPDSTDSAGAAGLPATSSSQGTPAGG